MNNQDTYKKRTIILSHDNDCYHHVEEMRRWNEYLVTNTNKTISKNSARLSLISTWRGTLSSFGDLGFVWKIQLIHYREPQTKNIEILKKLIYNSGNSSQEIGKKKRIILIKHNKEDNEEEEI